MQNNEIIAQTEAHVRDVLAAEGTGHDWWHIHRVRNIALRIAQEEGADAYVVELTALLHDLGDWKDTGDHEAGPREARAWLEKLGAEERVIETVCDTIRHLSFKGGEDAPLATLEGRVVRDADRLDGMGAIGIARCFTYGGAKNRVLHDPAVAAKPDMTPAEFQKISVRGGGTTLNHFYEKLLLLKDRMSTPAAKRIAEERHRFMERYLEEFHREWEGAA